MTNETSRGSEDFLLEAAYQADSTEEKFLVKEFVLSDRLFQMLRPFLKETGEGGFEVTDQKAFQETVNELINEATREMERQFPEMNAEKRRAIAEKVIVRGVVRYTSEKADLEKALPGLQVKDEIRKRAMKALEINPQIAFNE